MGRFIVPSFSICTGPDQSHRVPANFHTDTHREKWVCMVGSPYHTLSSLECWSCTAAVADGGDGEGCGVTVTFDHPCQRWRMTYCWSKQRTRSRWVGQTGWRRRVPQCRAVWRPCQGRAGCCGSPVPGAHQTARRRASSNGQSGPGPCTHPCSWRTGQCLQGGCGLTDGKVKMRMEDYKDKGVMNKIKNKAQCNGEVVWAFGVERRDVGGKWGWEMREGERAQVSNHLPMSQAENVQQKLFIKETRPALMERIVCFSPQLIHSKWNVQSKWCGVAETFHPHVNILKLRIDS